MKHIYKVALWIDDVRSVPQNYMEDNCVNRVIWCKSVHEAIHAYSLWGSNLNDDTIQLSIVDLDHDAGDYVSDGGDYINFLNWIELCHINDFPKIKWKIHSMNPVGRMNMQRIIEKNGAYCV